MEMPSYLEDLKAASAPLMKYFAENHHPHVTVIVTSNRAEMVEGMTQVVDDQYLRD